jgi:hypothetical protein
MSTAVAPKLSPGRKRYRLLLISGIVIGLVVVVAIYLVLRPHKAAVPGVEQKTQQKSDQRQRLIDAQDAARASDEFEPTETTTYCNAATYFVAQRVGAPTTGTLTDKKGNLVRANTQATNLAHSSDYKEVDSTQSQPLADQGMLVIAAYKNPDGPGHLATVRPQGVAGDDPPRASKAPLLNNIGRSVAVHGVNYAFRKGMKVHFYTPK